MNRVPRDPVATFALLGAGISSLLTGAGTVAARRQRRKIGRRSAVDRFGYPSGEEGESPDVDQRLIGEITAALSVRPKGLAS